MIYKSLGFFFLYFFKLVNKTYFSLFHILILQKKKKKINNKLNLWLKKLKKKYL